MPTSQEPQEFTFLGRMIKTMLIVVAVMLLLLALVGGLGALLGR